MTTTRRSPDTDTVELDPQTVRPVVDAARSGDDDALLDVVATLESA